MRPSVFERLELWMVEWFHLNGKQANTTKTRNLSQFCDFIMRVSVDNYFFPSVNILKTLWRSYCEKISITNIKSNCSNVIHTIFGNFSKQTPILCVYMVFGGLTMAAPIGHLTIKFNSIKFNSLGWLLKLALSLMAGIWAVREFHSIAILVVLCCIYDIRI